MDHPHPFITRRRVSQTVSPQPDAVGPDARFVVAPLFKAPGTTPLPRCNWDVIEAKWAAMTRRAQGGESRAEDDPLPPSLLLSMLRGEPHDEMRAVAEPDGAARAR